MIVIPDDQYDRRKYIGSSNVAAVLGVSKYQTPYDVYLSKTSDIPEELDPEKKKFLERRRRWEPVVFQTLREEFDAEIVATNRRYRDEEVPYFAAEIDFEWRDVDGTIQNGEVKTVHPLAFGESKGWGEAGSSDIPIEYECQVLHGLGITGRSKTAVAAMVGLDQLVLYEVHRNDDLLADVRQRLKDFWVNHVLALVPPEIRTVGDVERVYRVSQAGMRLTSASDAVAVAAMRLRAIRAQIDAFEFQADALEFEIKKAMREAESLYVEGRKMVTWKEQNFSHLDTAALKAAHPKIYRQFLKTGRRRVFKALKSRQPITIEVPTIEHLPEVPALEDASE